MSRRMNMRPNPAMKHMHIYENFARGINSMDTDENILESELVDLTNIEIGERGSLVRRHGMVEHVVFEGDGYGQGFFTYFREGGVVEEIVAISGKLYKDGVELPIEGLENGFQTERQIEAVQWRDILYIATGSKLCQYDGDIAKVVDPYVPKPLDALYLGVNALADDPYNFMQDGESEHLRIDGITFNKRYGLINEPITLTAFISKPSNVGTIEYKFEQRTEEHPEGFWETGQDWSTSKVYTFDTTYQGRLQFRVWARPVGGTDFDAKQSLVPNYIVKAIADPDDEDVPHDMIHTCNRLLVHWDRLLMFGDVDNPDALFISHNKNMTYFPMSNSLVFENEEREQITSIVRYRNNLVVFTPNSIQALYGYSPEDFQRVVMNTSVGCIAPNSVVVTDNYITFLSYEGVYILKSLGYTEDKANVDKIDGNISNLIESMSNKEKACAILHDNQYHILFPDDKVRYRVHIHHRSWTKDFSEKLDFMKMYRIGEHLYGQREDGDILRFDKNVYDDAGYVYEDRIETKYFDFGEPYHDKKLREIQLIMHNQNQRTSISTFIYADAALVVGTDTSHASVNEIGEVVWNYESDPNLEIYSGTALGDWIMGNSPFGTVGSEVYKMRLKGRSKRAKIILSHQDTTPIRLIGLGWIFKTKKP